MAIDNAGVPWGSPKLRAILACTLVLPLGAALLSPVLPVIRDSFALTDAHASLLITVYFAPGIILSPVIGLLADRYGRRHVIIPSLVCFGIAGSVIVLVDHFTIVLALRFVQGTASAGVFILTVTYISDVFDGLQRNAVLGINAAVLFSGAALYPFLGGILASYEWHLPFITYLLALPIAIYAFYQLDEPPIVKPRCGPGYLRGAAEALPRAEAGALYGSVFVLEAVAFGAVLTVLPFLLRADLAAGPFVTGTVITVMTGTAAVCAARNGTLARSRSNHHLIALSFLCYGLGLIVIWTGHSIPVVMGGVAVFGVGVGLVLPSVDAAIGRLAPAEYRAGALSIRNATTFLGRSTGPILFTSVAILTDYQTLILVSGIGLLLVGTIAIHVTDRSPSLGDGSVPY